MFYLRSKILILTPILLLIAGGLYAQSKGLKAHFEKRKLVKQEKIAKGLPLISPMIGPGYTPDAGFLFAIGGLLSFKTNRHDTLIQRSTLPTTFVVSSRGNVSFASRLKSFWWQDKFRLNVIVLLSDAQDDYFGVGYEMNSELPKGDSTTLYNRRSFLVQPEFLFRLVPDLYAGVLFDFNYTNAVETNPVMDNDPSFMEYGPENFNAGIGLTLQYDSRDIVVNAWEGIFASLTSTFYDPTFGSDNKYQVVLLDLRYYEQIKRDGRTMAFRFKGRYGFGDNPWSEMTRIGGSRDLRGYIKGQYRDIKGTHLSAEYRHMFLRRNKQLSTHGFTAWIAAGTVYEEFNSIDGILPNFGFGYRMEVQPRMNLRIDFGFGRETTGVYFAFTESF